MTITQNQLRQILVLSNQTEDAAGRSMIQTGITGEAGLAALLGSGVEAAETDPLRVGDLLGDAQLEDAGFRGVLESQQAVDGDAVAPLGELAEERLLRFLINRFETVTVDLRTFQPDPEKVRLIPEATARRFSAMVLMESPVGVLVGMSDPSDLFAADELGALLKRPTLIALVNHQELLRSLNLHYRNEEALKDYADELAEEVADSALESDADAGVGIRSDAPVVKIINSLFDDAVRMNASDIHIEPDEKVLRIRQRIDGALCENILNKKRIAPALISKIKLMSGMEISERRLAQDGRFQITVRDKPIDVRVSTMPTQNGESVVMRLLDQSKNNLKLDGVGLTAEHLTRLRRILANPHGMFLVTGPTGSGKTTTLYGALNELNTPERKIITVEDPVEYRLPRVNQVQVMSKIGWTFASVLRTALRQDPDVILVGEMRDRETAEIAVRAALTGHLVLSTVHTNDAVRTPVRLLDMGLEGYAVADSLLGILSQRLIRRICPDCAAQHRPTEAEQAWLDQIDMPESRGALTLSRGAGCGKCNQTGFRGRMAVVELLEITPELAEPLRAGDAIGFQRLATRQAGYDPIHIAALRHALAGATALSEAIRLCPNPAESPTALGRTNRTVRPHGAGLADSALNETTLMGAA